MSAEERALLRVVRGDASPEELAALLAVLTAWAAAAAAREGTAPRRASAWADRSRTVRGPLPHGPGAWRSSALPG